MRKKWGEGVETLLAERRYGYIAGMVKEAVQEESSLLARLSVSRQNRPHRDQPSVRHSFLLAGGLGIFQFHLHPRGSLVELLRDSSRALQRPQAFGFKI